MYDFTANKYLSLRQQLSKISSENLFSGELSIKYSKVCEPLKDYTVKWSPLWCWWWWIQDFVIVCYYHHSINVPTYRDIKIKRKAHTDLTVDELVLHRPYCIFFNTIYIFLCMWHTNYWNNWTVLIGITQTKLKIRYSLLLVLKYLWGLKESNHRNNWTEFYRFCLGGRKATVLYSWKFCV